MALLFRTRNRQRRYTAADGTSVLITRITGCRAPASPNSLQGDLLDGGSPALGVPRSSASDCKGADSHVIFIRVGTHM